MIKKILSAILLLSIFNSCTKTDAIIATQASYPISGNNFFPEGIAYNPTTGFFYTGSVTNGDIMQVHIETGDTKLFSTGSTNNRAAATGMKVDSKNRLWVCGGADNKIQVLNADGTLLKSWDVKALFNSGFINDCTLDNNFVYFTDAQVKKIYRASVTETQPTTLEEWLTFTDAQIPYVTTGTNANGIVNTPDGKYLIIVVSTSGKLYRIDRASKAITEITLNTPVTSGDGMWLEGQTLYVSRNATGQIFPVTLSIDYTFGTVGTGFGTGLLFNTTIAKTGQYFLVVNGQLDKRASATNPTPAAPVLPFSISRVLIP